MMDKEKIQFTLCKADAIELQYARRVLFAIGLGGYRHEKDDDSLLVHRRESMFGDYAFYRQTTQRTQETFVGKLTVDEGFYTCLDHNGIFCARSLAAYELVDNVTFLRVICRALFPDWDPISSPYLGKGRGAQYYLEQFIEKLNGFENDWVKFVKEEKQVPE